MNTSNEKALSVLNELIETCKDGEKGFSTAADSVKDAELKTLFSQYATQRANFARELQNEVQALGGKPDHSGSAAGALHRGWIDVKSAVMGRDEHAVLEECERGEDIAKDAYAKAAEGTDLPGMLLPLIQKQFESVKEAHDRMKALRDGVPVSRR
jgi:uncharacterized protein (TIGR02284 family)